MIPVGSTNRSLHDWMEHATRALIATDYFEAERLAEKALARARARGAYDAAARICPVLQESRRQRRHQAVDAGHVMVACEFPGKRGDLVSGCYLVTPPLIGVEARTIRDLLTRKRVPALVIAREPTAASGKWPIVAVGSETFHPVVVRVQVQPPASDTPTPAWFVAAQEALGDAAIAKVSAALPPDHRAQDLFECLDAVPDHEKLIQAAMHACEQAALMPEPSSPRRKGMFDDPFSF